MEIIEATADLELRIVYDMINSTQFLEEFADKYKQGVLSNRYYSVMARLCIVFFNKFKTAPADKFERIFKSQIALGKIKPEVASEIQIVLSSFANQEPITDVQVEIDSAYSYFQSQIIKLSAEEANALVESGKLDEAKQILNSVEEIKPVVVNSTDILQASDEEIDDLFRQEDERLISFEGELGRLMNNTLTRNSFVVFEGRGKVGKSHMLIYTARVARNQGNKTLFISCGDLTKNQVNKRILCGDAKTSTSPEYADKQFIPCLDCLKNQKGTCFERKGSGNLLNEWNDIPDKPVITSEEYIPCDDKACKEYKEAISYRQVHNPILTPEIAKLMRDSWCNQKHKGSLYVEQFPLGSLTYGGLVTLTKNICKKLGWEHPDVVVIDYIDAMATEGRDPREAVNQRWRSIRAYADIFKCLVVTATQSNATGFNTEDLTLASFSEDKRKIDNCSALYAINQTPEERIKNIWRIAALLKRESPYDERQQAKLYGCLACGTPHILSVHNFAELPKPTMR